MVDFSWIVATEILSYLGLADFFPDGWHLEMVGLIPRCSCNSF